MLYLDILEYRKQDSLRKKTKYPKLHFLHNNLILAKTCMLLGVTLIFMNMFLTYQPGMDAYKWTTFQNVAFYVSSRLTYALGWMLLAFYMFMGYSKLGINSLGNSTFCLLGKTLFCVYLIAPIIMMVVYASTETGVFMTLIGNSYLGIGHLFLAFIFAVFIYLFLEY